MWEHPLSEATRRGLPNHQKEVFAMLSLPETKPLEEELDEALAEVGLPLTVREVARKLGISVEWSCALAKAASAREEQPQDKPSFVPG